MATKKQLEDRIEGVYELYDELRQKVHSLGQEVKTMRENEKNIVDEQIAINRHLNKISPKQAEPECIEIQRGDSKNHKVYLNAGDKVVIDGHEIGFKRTDEGQLVCDHTAYNPTSEFTVSKEPDYLQVGDQWRDEEGNEYVLTKIMIKNSENSGKYFVLVNKDTGGRKGAISFGLTEGRTMPFNNTEERRELGITDNMIKIK